MNRLTLSKRSLSTKWAIPKIYIWYISINWAKCMIWWQVSVYISKNWFKNISTNVVKMPIIFIKNRIKWKICIFVLHKIYIIKLDTLCGGGGRTHRRKILSNSFKLLLLYDFNWMIDVKIKILYTSMRNRTFQIVCLFMCMNFIIL